MTTLPEEVSLAWEKRSGPVVFVTVDENKMPNAIYATCVRKYDESTLIVADNYFQKTKKNLLGCSNAAILFITDDGKSYQVKGRADYYTDGDIFKNMKEWNPKKHPGHGVAALRIEEVFSGANALGVDKEL